jgi:hypothetical protein
MEIVTMSISDDAHSELENHFEMQLFYDQSLTSSRLRPCGAGGDFLIRLHATDMARRASGCPLVAVTR